MIKNQEILAIVPARGGSKGVKRKNLRLLKDKPLLQWTIDEANKSKYIDKVIVSTEDNEIEEVSKVLNVEVIKRPEELAQDNSPTIDAVIHVLNKLQEKEYNPAYVILLQCTSPMRTAEHIDEAIEKLLSDKATADSLVSVTKEEHPPWWLKEIDVNGHMRDFIGYDKNKFSRRQDFPPIYRLNGAIYVCKTRDLLRHRNFQTDKTIAYEMDAIASVDIDSEECFSWVEYLLKR